MSRARALLGRDVKREQQDIQRKAAKQDLWSSIGSTVGTLALTGLTGGVVNPLTAGLLTGAGSLIGGAIGSKLLKINMAILEVESSFNLIERNCLIN